MINMTNHNRNMAIIGILLAYSLISTTLFFKSYLQYSQTLDSLSYDIVDLRKQLKNSQEINEDVKKQRQILVNAIKAQDEKIDKLHDEVKLHSEVIDSIKKKTIKKTR
jgi:chromosome segregation ATPase